MIYFKTTRPVRLAQADYTWDSKKEFVKRDNARSRVIAALLARQADALAVAGNIPGYCTITVAPSRTRL